MKKILIVAGTRPNFIKITQCRRVAAEMQQFDLRIVHTGQHYDDKMANVFFQQLQLNPDYFLQIDNADPETQVRSIRNALHELILHTFFPDLVMVVGDVNSTRAAAEAADALHIPVAHIESGLRSFDDTMPEEYNRIVADRIAKWHFVTEKSGLENLKEEGYPATGICFCGNTMIDTLIHFSEVIEKNTMLEHYALKQDQFALITLHRPSNVDDENALRRSVNLITDTAEKIPVVFPVHPRTLKKLQQFGLNEILEKTGNIILTEPLDYFSFQQLIRCCSFIITDSGGIQEEATFRQKPCLTIRPNTERPSTIEIGSNTLVDWDLALITQLISDIQNDRYKTGNIPPLWDGHATERIFQFLAEVL